MVPRTEIIAVDVSVDIDEVKKIFIETGFSKIPVYKKSIDNIIGYVHSFDFLKNPSDIKSFLLPVEFIPEPMFVNEVLQILTRQRKSLAVILDEYGWASGILTIEDIVEELFGVNGNISTFAFDELFAHVLTWKWKHVIKHKSF